MSQRLARDIVSEGAALPRARSRVWRNRAVKRRLRVIIDTRRITAAHLNRIRAHIGRMKP